MNLSGARSQKEAIAVALREFVRAKRLERLASRIGAFDLALSRDELNRTREDE